MIIDHSDEFELQMKTRARAGAGVGVRGGHDDGDLIAEERVIERHLEVRPRARLVAPTLRAHADADAHRSEPRR